MELEKLLLLEQATARGRREMFRLGTSLLFLVGIILYITMRGGEISYSLVVAAMIGGYMALNIATASGAPVSTTHSIVGGVLGAGIAAGGWGIVDWGQMGQTAASWVISPVLGGVIAAGFLYLIKRTITYKPDMLLAARKMVPILLALMAWAFSTYLVMKGLKKIWKMDFTMAMLIGFGFALAVFAITRPMIAAAAVRIENNKQGVNSLFIIPLIFSAALLSFAHGANDVANAVGPLAAINEAVMHGTGRSQGQHSHLGDDGGSHWHCARPGSVWSQADQDSGFRHYRT